MNFELEAVLAKKSAIVVAAVSKKWLTLALWSRGIKNQPNLHAGLN